MTAPPRRYRSTIEDSARWEGFAFRDGDVVISSPSKSGTTWTQMICALLIFQTPELPAPLTRLSPWMDAKVRPAAEVHAALERQSRRRFVKTHTPLDGVPIREEVRYLAIGRDPRDVAVSLYHQGRNLDRDHVRSLTGEPARRDELSPQGPPASEREFFLRWRDAGDEPQHNLDTLRGLAWQQSRAWERRERPNVTLVHYGDLTGDLDGQMRRIAQFLDVDVDEDRWPELVRAAQFDSMRDRAAERAPDEGLGLFHSSESFFRSGGGGAWRAWSTEEDRRGYAARVEELLEPDLASWLHHGDAGRNLREQT